MKHKIKTFVLFSLIIGGCGLAGADEFATADELGLMKAFPVPKEMLVSKENTRQTSPNKSLFIVTNENYLIGVMMSVTNSFCPFFDSNNLNTFDIVTKRLTQK